MNKDLNELLAGKKLSVAVLDHGWHEIFQYVKPTKELKQAEEQLNAVLQRQGKLNNESKEIKKLKQKLMDEIVHLMDSIDGGKGDAQNHKKLEENRRLINDCNAKLEQYDDELMELPREIDHYNKILIIETIELCCQDMEQNNKVIGEISDWLNRMRVELKKQVLRKQDREIRNRELYRHLDNIVGAEIMDELELPTLPKKEKE